MKFIQRNALIALAASAVVIGSAQGAAAQEPAPPPQEAAQEAAQFTGELIAVDPETSTLTVRNADGTEKEFRYHESTEIVGAEDGAAGLATMSGATVTVHYAAGADAHGTTATRIEVSPRQ